MAAASLMLATFRATPTQASEADMTTVREHVNVARVRAGLRPLRRSRLLTLSADRMAARLQPPRPFRHQDRIHVAHRWIWVGEVLAAGDYTPVTVVSAWLASPGHRAILLSPKPRAVGFARRGNIWVGHFGKLGP